MDNGEVDNVEVVPCPRNSSAWRSAPRSGVKQLAPAAVSRVSMHSSGNVPSYSQSDDTAKKDEHGGQAALLRRVTMSSGYSV